MLKSGFAAAAMLTAALAAVPASAQTWNATTGFNTGLWSYVQRAGVGCTGAVTPLSIAYVGPPLTNFIGFHAVAAPIIVPLVAKNLAPSGTTVYSTAQIPAGAVWLHPGQTGANPQQCAAIRFRAPNAGTYRVKGFIKSIDTGANKVNGYIFASNANTGPALALSGPMGTALNFDRIVTVPAGPPAGRTIDFALNDGGSYFNDSTQLELSITRCKGKNGKDAANGDASHGANGDNVNGC